MDPALFSPFSGQMQFFLLEYSYRNIQVFFKKKQNTRFSSDIGTNQKGVTEMEKYVCDVCGWEYDPAVGDPDNGIEPGTAFEDLPDDFECPLCGVGKDQFSKAD